MREGCSQEVSPFFTICLFRFQEAAATLLAAGTRPTGCNWKTRRPAVNLAVKGVGLLRELEVEGAAEETPETHDATLPRKGQTRKKKTKQKPSRRFLVVPRARERAVRG